MNSVAPAGVNSSALDDLDSINDEEVLRHLWQSAEDFGERRKIRARMYKLREHRLREMVQNDEESLGALPKTEEEESRRTETLFTAESLDDDQEPNIQVKIHMDENLTSKGSLGSLTVLQGDRESVDNESEDLINERIEKSSQQRGVRYQQILGELAGQNDGSHFNKSAFSIQSNALSGEGYLSMKNKEIRDSESPTRMVHERRTFIESNEGRQTCDDEAILKTEIKQVIDTLISVSDKDEKSKHVQSENTGRKANKKVVERKISKELDFGSLSKNELEKSHVTAKKLPVEGSPKRKNQKKLPLAKETPTRLPVKKKEKLDSTVREMEAAIKSELEKLDAYLLTEAEAAEEVLHQEEEESEDASGHKVKITVETRGAKDGGQFTARRVARSTKIVSREEDVDEILIGNPDHEVLDRDVKEDVLEDGSKIKIIIETRCRPDGVQYTTKNILKTSKIFDFDHPEDVSYCEDDELLLTEKSEERDECGAVIETITEKRRKQDGTEYSTKKVYKTCRTSKSIVPSEDDELLNVKETENEDEQGNLIKTVIKTRRTKDGEIYTHRQVFRSRRRTYSDYDDDSSDDEEDSKESYDNVVDDNYLSVNSSNDSTRRKDAMTFPPFIKGLKDFASNRSDTEILELHAGDTDFENKATSTYHEEENDIQSADREKDFHDLQMPELILQIGSFDDEILEEDRKEKVLEDGTMYHTVTERRKSSVSGLHYTLRRMSKIYQQCNSELGDLKIDEHCTEESTDDGITVNTILRRYRRADGTVYTTYNVHKTYNMSPTISLFDTEEDNIIDQSYEEEETEDGFLVKTIIETRVNAKGIRYTVEKSEKVLKSVPCKAFAFKKDRKQSLIYTPDSYIDVVVQKDETEEIIEGITYKIIQELRRRADGSEYQVKTVTRFVPIMVPEEETSFVVITATGGDDKEDVTVLPSPDDEIVYIREKTDDDGNAIIIETRENKASGEKYNVTKKVHTAVVIMTQDGEKIRSQDYKETLQADEDKIPYGSVSALKEYFTDHGETVMVDDNKYKSIAIESLKGSEEAAIENSKCIVKVNDPENIKEHKNTNQLLNGVVDSRSEVSEVNTEDKDLKSHTKEETDTKSIQNFSKTEKTHCNILKINNTKDISDFQKGKKIASTLYKTANEQSQSKVIENHKQTSSVVNKANKITRNGSPKKSPIEKKSPVREKTSPSSAPCKSNSKTNYTDATSRKVNTDSSTKAKLTTSPILSRGRSPLRSTKQAPNREITPSRGRQCCRRDHDIQKQVSPVQQRQLHKTSFEWKRKISPESKLNEKQQTSVNKSEEKLSALKQKKANQLENTLKTEVKDYSLKHIKQKELKLEVKDDLKRNDVKSPIIVMPETPLVEQKTIVKDGIAIVDVTDEPYLSSCSLHQPSLIQEPNDESRQCKLLDDETIQSKRTAIKNAQKERTIGFTNGTKTSIIRSPSLEKEKPTSNSLSSDKKSALGRFSREKKPTSGSSLSEGRKSPHIAPSSDKRFKSNALPLDQAVSSSSSLSPNRKKSSSGTPSPVRKKAPSSTTSSPGRISPFSTHSPDRKKSQTSSPSSRRKTSPSSTPSPDRKKYPSSTPSLHSKTSDRKKSPSRMPIPNINVHTATVSCQEGKQILPCSLEENSNLLNDQNLDVDSTKVFEACLIDNKSQSLQNSPININSYKKDSSFQVSRDKVELSDKLFTKQDVIKEVSDKRSVSKTVEKKLINNKSKEEPKTFSLKQNRVVDAFDQKKLRTSPERNIFSEKPERNPSGEFIGRRKISRGSDVKNVGSNISPERHNKRNFASSERREADLSNTEKKLPSSQEKEFSKRGLEDSRDFSLKTNIATEMDSSSAKSEKATKITLRDRLNRSRLSHRSFSDQLENNTQKEKNFVSLSHLKRADDIGLGHKDDRITKPTVEENTKEENNETSNIITKQKKSSKEEGISALLYASAIKRTEESENIECLSVPVEEPIAIRKYVHPLGKDSEKEEAEDIQDIFAKERSLPFCSRESTPGRWSKESSPGPWSKESSPGPFSKEGSPGRFLTGRPIDQGVNSNKIRRLERSGSNKKLLEDLEVPVSELPSYVTRIESIMDSALLENMLVNASSYEERRLIRGRLRLLKKSSSTSIDQPTTSFSHVYTEISSSPKPLLSLTSAQSKKKQLETAIMHPAPLPTDNRLAQPPSPQKKPVRPSELFKKSLSTSPDRLTSREVSKKVESPISRKDSKEKQVFSSAKDKKTAGGAVASEPFNEPLRHQKGLLGPPVQVQTDVDKIVSPYGLGPTDENGLPLFGLRALKMRRQQQQREEETKSKLDVSPAEKFDRFATTSPRTDNEQNDKTHQSCEEGIDDSDDERKKVEILNRNNLERNQRQEDDTNRTLIPNESEGETSPGLVKTMRDSFRRQKNLEEETSLTRPTAKYRDTFLRQNKTPLVGVEEDVINERSQPLKNIIQLHESKVSETPPGSPRLKPKQKLRSSFEPSLENGLAENKNVKTWNVVSDLSSRSQNIHNIITKHETLTTSLPKQETVAQPIPKKPLVGILKKKSSTETPYFSFSRDMPYDAGKMESTEDRKSSAKDFGLLKDQASEYSTEFTATAEEGTESERNKSHEGLVRKTSYTEITLSKPTVMNGSLVDASSSPGYESSSTSRSFSSTHRKNSEDDVTHEGRSFLNDKSKVTGVTDILERMSSTQAVDLDGGVQPSDAEARSLLNRFLGAQVLMTGVESMMSATESSVDAQGINMDKTEVLNRQSSPPVSATSKHRPSGDLYEVTDAPIVIKGVDINQVDDDFELNDLLDSCEDYEDRRRIRLRLKALMAEKKAQQGEPYSHAKEDAKRPLLGKRKGELESVILGHLQTILQSLGDGVLTSSHYKDPCLSHINGEQGNGSTFSGNKEFYLFMEGVKSYIDSSSDSGEEVNCDLLDEVQSVLGRLKMRISKSKSQKNVSLGQDKRQEDLVALIERLEGSLSKKIKENGEDTKESLLDEDNEVVTTLVEQKELNSINQKHINDCEANDHAGCSGDENVVTGGLRFSLNVNDANAIVMKVNELKSEKESKVSGSSCLSKSLDTSTSSLLQKQKSSSIDDARAVLSSVIGRCQSREELTRHTSNESDDEVFEESYSNFQEGTKLDQREFRKKKDIRELPWKIRAAKKRMEKMEKPLLIQSSMNNNYNHIQRHKSLSSLFNSSPKPFKSSFPQHSQSLGNVSEMQKFWHENVEGEFSSKSEISSTDNQSAEQLFTSNSASSDFLKSNHANQSDDSDKSESEESDDEGEVFSLKPYGTPVGTRVHLPGIFHNQENYSMVKHFNLSHCAEKGSVIKKSEFFVEKAQEVKNDKTDFHSNIISKDTQMVSSSPSVKQKEKNDFVATLKRPDTLPLKSTVHDIIPQEDISVKNEFNIMNGNNVVDCANFSGHLNSRSLASNNCQFQPIQRNQLCRSKSTPNAYLTMLPSSSSSKFMMKDFGRRQSSLDEPKDTLSLNTQSNFVSRLQQKFEKQIYLEKEAKVSEFLGRKGECTKLKITGSVSGIASKIDEITKQANENSTYMAPVWSEPFKDSSKIVSSDPSSLLFTPEQLVKIAVHKAAINKQLSAAHNKRNAMVRASSADSAEYYLERNDNDSRRTHSVSDATAHIQQFSSNENALRFKDSDKASKIHIFESIGLSENNFDLETQSDFKRQKQLDMQSQKEILIQKQKEIEIHKQQKQNLQRQKEIELHRQKEQELLRQKEFEHQRTKEQEFLRQNELELQKQREQEFQRQRQSDFLKQNEQEFQRQKEFDLQKQKEQDLFRKNELELQKQRDEACQGQNELELHKRKELKLQRQKELEFQRQKKLEFQKQREEELQRQRELDLQKQREQEFQRKKDLELLRHREQELHRQKELEAQKRKELQLQQQREQAFQRQRELDLQREREQELQRQKELEVQKQKEQDLQRLKEFELQQQRKQALQKQRELDLQRQREQEFQRQNDLELQRQRERELQKQNELEVQKQKELQLQQQREKANQRQKELALQKQKEQEFQRKKELELHWQKEQELQKQKELEQQRQKEQELQKQKELELEKYKEHELQKQKEVEWQRQKEQELLRQKEIDLKKQREQEFQRQKYLELQRQKEQELQNQREFEFQPQWEQSLQKQKELYLQRQREIEIQRQMELELQRQKEQKIQRQEELEFQKQREQALQRQRELDLQGQREIALQKQMEKQIQRQKELELQKKRELEIQRQVDVDLQRQTLLRQNEQEHLWQIQSEIQRQQELDLQNQKEIENIKERKLENYISQNGHEISLQPGNFSVPSQTSNINKELLNSKNTGYQVARKDPPAHETQQNRSTNITWNADCMSKSTLYNDKEFVSLSNPTTNNKGFTANFRSSCKLNQSEAIEKATDSAILPELMQPKCLTLKHNECISLKRSQSQKSRGISERQKGEVFSHKSVSVSSLPESTAYVPLTANPTDSLVNSHNLLTSNKCSPLRQPFRNATSLHRPMSMIEHNLNEFPRMSSVDNLTSAKFNNAFSDSPCNYLRNKSSSISILHEPAALERSGKLAISDIASSLKNVSVTENKTSQNSIMTFKPKILDYVVPPLPTTEMRQQQLKHKQHIQKVETRHKLREPIKNIPLRRQETSNSGQISVRWGSNPENVSSSESTENLFSQPHRKNISSASSIQKLHWQTANKDTGASEIRMLSSSSGQGKVSETWETAILSSSNKTTTCSKLWKEGLLSDVSGQYVKRNAELLTKKHEQNSQCESVKSNLKSKKVQKAGGEMLEQKTNDKNVRNKVNNKTLKWEERLGKRTNLDSNTCNHSVKEKLKQWENNDFNDSPVLREGRERIKVRGKKDKWEKRSISEGGSALSFEERVKRLSKEQLQNWNKQDSSSSNYIKDASKANRISKLMQIDNWETSLQDESKSEERLPWKEASNIFSKVKGEISKFEDNVSTAVTPEQSFSHCLARTKSGHIKMSIAAFEHGPMDDELHMPQYPIHKSKSSIIKKGVAIFEETPTVYTPLRRNKSYTSTFLNSDILSTEQNKPVSDTEFPSSEVQNVSLCIPVKASYKERPLSLTFHPRESSPDNPVLPWCKESFQKSPSAALSFKCDSYESNVNYELVKQKQKHLDEFLQHGKHYLYQTASKKDDNAFGIDVEIGDWDDLVSGEDLNDSNIDEMFSETLLQDIDIFEEDNLPTVSRTRTFSETNISEKRQEGGLQLRRSNTFKDRLDFQVANVTENLSSIDGNEITYHSMTTEGYDVQSDDSDWSGESGASSHGESSTEGTTSSIVSSTSQSTSTFSQDNSQKSLSFTSQRNVTSSSPAKGNEKVLSPFDKFKQLDAQNLPKRASSTKSGCDGGGPLFKLSSSLHRSASEVKDMLLHWCQCRTRDHKNVNIENFSTSWNDGMAFCALIHHFYPDAFNYDELNPRNRRTNFELAFRIADEKAGIMPLLDVDDMVKMKKPDWKCVFTYVQTLYKRLKDE